MLLHGYNSSDGSFSGTSLFSNSLMEEAQKGDSIIVDKFTFTEAHDLYKSDGVTFSLVDGWEAIKEVRLEAEMLLLEASTASNARSKRNALITATDYFALTDVTMGAAVTTYRQALRDIPTQTGFPNEITWPTPP